MSHTDQTDSTQTDSTQAHTEPTSTEQTHTEQTEIERKYAVDDERSLPDLAGLGEAVGTPVAEVVSLEPFELEAVYFDTATLALARRRIALRRRSGGHDEGWHIKLPAEEGRTELQWPLGEARDDSGRIVVPVEVLDAVRVHVRDREVTPLARIRTVRRVTELRDAAGAVVVELSDDTVEGSDARHGAVTLWREWEAELGEGAPATAKKRAALLDEVEARLLDAGATVSPSVSKLAQALGRTGLDSETAAADPAAPPTAAVPEATRVVLAGLAELVDRLIELDPAVRADEPDAVHRERTTVRRLRNLLAVHRSLFDEATVAGLRDALSLLGAVLGEVRDLEVRTDWARHALDELESERGVDDPDARRRLIDEPTAEHDEAHARLVAVLSREPYFRLLDDLEEFVAPAVGAPQGSAKPGRSKAVVSEARKQAKRALRSAGRRAVTRTVPAQAAAPVLAGEVVEAATALGALHDSRKAARRLRHAAEFATDGPAAVLGSRAEEIGDTAEELQDALGLHRDAALFAEYLLLTARRAEAAGEGGFTYGVLYQRSIDQARRALRLADDARRELKRTV